MAEKNKLTPELIEKICARKRADPSLTKVALAAEFDVNRKTIDMALVHLAGAVPDASPSSLSMLAFESITRSPLNPRKTFDEAELSELAESIAVNGLLQNLVVRPGPDSSFILMAGERRLRAIGLLVEAGRWNAPIPCLVIDADEATHLALALLENLHRQDVPALEEAAAFAQLQALDPETYTAHAIAARIGRTERYVYQRLALARNLCEDGKALFIAGKLNVEGARLLAAQDADTQEFILDAVWWNWETTDADIRELVIEEDDDDISAKDIANQIGYRKRVQEQQAAREKAEAEGAVVSEDDAKAEETPEDIAANEAREARIAANQAEWKAQNEARAAAEAEKLARFKAITKRLDTDYPPFGDGEDADPNTKYCDSGCKWRVLLAWSAPSDFHVCTSPTGPRAGLLTESGQGGDGCFEVA